MFKQIKNWINGYDVVEYTTQDVGRKLTKNEMVHHKNFREWADSFEDLNKAYKKIHQDTRINLSTVKPENEV